MGQLRHTAAGRLALGSLMAAGSLAVLMLACMLPTGQIGMTALAGVFPMVCVLTGGRVCGYLCWAASSILGFLLLPSKAVALLYAMFLGLYPVLKERIEALRRLPVEWLVKLLVCNLTLSCVFFVFQTAFLPILPDWRFELIYLFANGAFIIYDLGLSQLIGALRHQLRLHRRF